MTGSACRHEHGGNLTGDELLPSGVAQSKVVVLALVGARLALATPAAASIIGTFSAARAGIDYHFDLFGGMYMAKARAESQMKGTE